MTTISKLEGWHALWEMGFHPDHAPIVINLMSREDIAHFQHSFRGDFRLIPDGTLGPWTADAWHRSIYDNPELCLPYLTKYCMKTH